MKVGRQEVDGRQSTYREEDFHFVYFIPSQVVTYNNHSPVFATEKKKKLGKITKNKVKVLDNHSTRDCQNTVTGQRRVTTSVG